MSRSEKMTNRVSLSLHPKECWPRVTKRTVTKFCDAEVLSVGSEIGTRFCLDTSFTHDWNVAIRDLYIGQILIILHQNVVFRLVLLDHVGLQYQGFEI